MSEKKRFERLFLYALFGYMTGCAPAPSTSPPPTTPHFTSGAPPFDPPRARHSRPVERPRLRTTRDTPSPSIPQDMWIFRRDFLFFGHRFIEPLRHPRVFCHRTRVGTHVVGATVLELGNFTYNIVLLSGKRFVQGRPASGETLRRDAVRGVHAPVELRGRDDVRVVFSIPKAQGHAVGLRPGRRLVHPHRGKRTRASLALRAVLQRTRGASRGARRPTPTRLEALKKVKKKIGAHDARGPDSCLGRRRRPA